MVSPRAILASNSASIAIRPPIRLLGKHLDLGINIPRRSPMTAFSGASRNAYRPFSRRASMRRVMLMAVAVLVLVLACSGGSGNFVGKWESTFGGVTLDLKADNTAEFTVVGIQREGTWEVVGKNQIVVKGGAQDLALTLDDDGALSGRGGTFVRQK